MVSKPDELLNTRHQLARMDREAKTIVNARAVDDMVAMADRLCKMLTDALDIPEAAGKSIEPSV